MSEKAFVSSGTHIQRDFPVGMVESLQNWRVWLPIPSKTRSVRELEARFSSDEQVGR